MFGPVLVKPAARGKVMLRTPMADSKPRVVCNFLTTEEDRAAFVEGTRLALEIAAQPALQAVERGPFSVPASDSDEDILAWGRRNSQPVYHPPRPAPSARSSTRSFASTGSRGSGWSMPR